MMNKLKRIMRRIKTLIWIADNWDQLNSSVINRIRKAENLIKYRTDISADVHFHGKNRNQIIVTGRYRNGDYVQVFTLADNDFQSLIKQIKEMERFGVVDKVDCMPSMKAFVERDLKL